MENELDKEKIIKQYMHNMAMKSVEVQKGNKKKFSDMGKRSVEVRRANRRAKTQAKQDVLFCEKIVRNSDEIDKIINEGKLSCSYLEHNLYTNPKRASMIIDMIKKEFFIIKTGNELDELIINKKEKTDDFLTKGKTKDDILYKEAKKVAQEEGKISILILREKLDICSARSAKLIDMLKIAGAISSK